MAIRNESFKRLSKPQWVQLSLARGSVSLRQASDLEQFQDSGLSPYSISEMVGQRIQFTRQSVEDWEQFPTSST